jgi:hypothetical protein
MRTLLGVRGLAAPLVAQGIAKGLFRERLVEAKAHLDFRLKRPRSPSRTKLDLAEKTTNLGISWRKSRWCFERIRTLDIVIAIPFVMHDVRYVPVPWKFCQPCHQVCRYVFPSLLAAAGFRASLWFWRLSLIANRPDLKFNCRT